VGYALRRWPPGRRRPTATSPWRPMPRLAACWHG